MIKFNQELLTSLYTRAYARPDFKSDSPDLSRILLIGNIVEMLDKGVKPIILDIGSGRQSLEKELLISCKKRPWLNQLKMNTIDIAKIHYKDLLAGKYGVPHTQADALFLPFPDNTFGLVVSNLAIDLLPHQAFSEAARVLSSDGYALFNFHHPSLTENMSNTKSVREFWTYLKKNRILFENPHQIETILKKYNLKTQNIEIRSDGSDEWWEVIAKK